MEPTLTIQSGRNSIGHHRMSLLPSVQGSQPSMQPTTPPLPVPQFDSEELTARMQIFTNELNSCIQRIKSRIADGTEQWVQETSELQAMDRSLREELKVAQVQEQAVVKTLKKEKEEASVISKEVQQLTDTHDEVSETKQALMAQVNQLRKEVKAKREAKIAEKKALDEQVLKNRPELATFESVLAVRIVGVKEDHIGFVFTRISEQDWEKEFTVTVDVSHHDFQVSECSPNLPDLDTHLQYLNDTRDFYGFLKRIRKAFIELRDRKSVV